MRRTAPLWALLAALPCAWFVGFASGRAGERGCRAADAPPAIPCQAQVAEWGDLEPRLTEVLTSETRAGGRQLAEGLARTQAKVGYVWISRVPGSPPPSLADVYASARRSVVVVAKPYKCGKCEHTHFESATAFAVGHGGIFATNYHVLAGDYPAIAVIDCDGQVHPVLEALAGSKDDDIALFRADLDVLTLNVRGDAPVGTRVAVVGHPQTRWFSMSDGILSRYWLDGPGRVPAVATTADYAVGSSGSPVLDEEGNVVAVASQTSPVEADPTKAETLQMVVKRCVPASALLRLMGRSGPGLPGAEAAGP